MLTAIDNINDKTSTSKKTSCIEAVLTKAISYKKNGTNINISEGTTIFVDSSRMIALFNGDHMDIARHEYEFKS